MSELLLLAPLDPAAEVSPPGRLRRLTTRSRTDDGRNGYFELALRDTPWMIRDAVRLTARLALAAAGLLISWVGCSGTTDFRKQVLWLAAGAAATALGAIAASTWLLSGFGMVGRERRAVRQELAAILAAVPTAVAGSSSSGPFVSGRGMRRFHVRGCDLVQGKRVVTVTSSAIASKHLVPCGMCQP